MKALFIKYPQNVSQYRNSVNGWEFIATVDSNEEAFKIVARLEDQDFFPQDDGTVKTASGAWCYDPAHPDCFEFGDYTYYVVEVSEIDVPSDKYSAIIKERPWNMDDIYDQIQG